MITEAPRQLAQNAWPLCTIGRSSGGAMSATEAAYRTLGSFPFPRPLARQIHRVVKETGDLDHAPDAVEEQVPRFSTRGSDVVRPGIGVNLRSALARRRSSLERLQGETDQITISRYLVSPNSSRVKSSTSMICASARGRMTMVGTYLPARAAARSRTAASIRAMCSSAVPRMPSSRSSAAKPLSASLRA